MGSNKKAVTPEISGHFATFMEWADNIRKIKVLELMLIIQEIQSKQLNLVQKV